MLLVELFHYAVDFGFGSQQTDTAARILLACTTIDIQGQVITRLREVLVFLKIKLNNFRRFKESSQSQPRHLSTIRHGKKLLFSSGCV
jgi:hypothetical protein